MSERRGEALVQRFGSLSSDPTPAILRAMLATWDAMRTGWYDTAEADRCAASARARPA